MNGLDSGADYYLTKPFEPKELLACIRALTRRQPELRQTDALKYGDLRLEKTSFTLSCGERSVRLSRKEFDMMEMLMLNQKLVITKEKLLLKVWGYESDAEDNNVEVYIGFLRKKLRAIGSNLTIEVIRLLGTWDITTIRASMGMYLLCKAIHEQTDVRVLLTGEISDELFGYKYTDYAPTADAFQQESQKRIRELYMYDVLRADRCISSNSIEARVPFGDLDFVRYVMAIDPEKKLNSYGKGKYLLRKAFEGDWLPPEILWREKAAFSDAVGHSMVDDIKEYAESLYTDEEFQLRRANYSAHCMPFTKESLFYREIFEKYYHDQSRTIVGFWMPNKAWPNCNVNDPSARVLANYGASGV